jgi:tetratricopeptide (TPR) repeat protein
LYIGRQVLPFPRNISFVGRKSYLEQLTIKIDPRRFAGACLWIALDGLGGVGKTQIALQFAYHIQEVSPECLVLWVQASDPASFDNSYREIAQKLEMPGLKDEKADVKQLVFTALEGLSMPWLLVVDNADDYEVLRNADRGNTSRALFEYLPKRGNGAVLFTTRDHKAATGFAKANVIHVKEMSRRESTKLFENSFQVQNLSLLNDRASTTKLLDLLLDLPLAIKQAAAFINNNSTPIAEYLSLCNRSEEETIEVLSEDFEDDGRYNYQKNPVATTWLISFKQIRRQDPLAAEYLSFIGVIVRDDIPISLLPLGKSLLEQKKAIGTLIAYSFVTRRTGEESFDVHRLVYLATRNWLRMEDELLIWADKALNRLVEVIPAGGHTNREVWTRYLPHGIYIADMIEVRSDNALVVIELLDRIGRCQSSLGHYIGAEKMHQRTLALRETVHGEEHEDTLTSRNELGVALTDQGKYIEAEAMHRETLLLREKVSGKEHPNTLISRNNLGLVLSSQGKYAEAEEIYQETLLLREKVLGKGHEDTLISRNNLGSALTDQGKYVEAEAMHRETLLLQEKVLGKEHPDTLISRNNLGSALSDQGKYAKAEEIHQETLALKETVLGKEHPSALISRNELGVALANQGKYAKAEEMHRETLLLREKVSGKEHPDTLISRNNLGSALSDQGKYAEAEEIHKETLALQEKVLGKEHPHTLVSIYNLASVLQDQGNIGGAITLFQVELGRCEILYGPDHTETVGSRRNLASILESYKEVNM